MIIYFRVLLFLRICFIWNELFFFLFSILSHLFLLFVFSPQMFGDPGCPYIFVNAGLPCEFSICARIQVLAPATRIQL